MKRTLKSVVAATIVLGTVVPSVFASTASATNGAPSDISGNQYANAIGLMLNEGVMINYKDGTFQPGSHASRGQFIAYIYNILKNQGVITQDYTGSNPYHDEDTNFQKQINDMYLFGYLDGLDFTDKGGKDVIGEYWTAPAPWVAELLCNVAGVAYDNTKAWDAYKVACAQGWFKGTGYADGTTPSYYLNRDVMAQLLENFYVSQYPDALKGVPANLSLSAANATVAQGTSDALTLSGTDFAGNAATIDPSQVTYAVTAGDSKTTASNGFVNSNGVFVATAPGSYTVTATYGTALVASTTITVSGNPASLAVSAPDLVADYNSSTSTGSKSNVTVNVYDVNNNIVSNYNGQVTLAIANSYSGATINTATVNAVNGVATFELDVNGNAKAGDSITVNASIPGSSTVVGSGTVKVDAPVATSFSINYAPNTPHGLAVNSATPQTSVVATVNDQAGNALTNSSQYVTATISGPATFAGGLTTEQVWVGAGQSVPVLVVGKQGVSGNVVVTFSATGMQSSTFTIPAYVQTGTSSISSSAASSSIAEGSSTTVTVNALDSNGNLALGENGSVTVTGIPSGVTVNGANNSGSASFSLADGTAGVTVANNSYVGTGTLTFTYTVSNVQYTSTLPLSFAQGGSSHLAVTNVTNNVYAPAGSTQAVTFQLEDASGAAVHTSGDTFSLTATNGTLSSSTATTDANGQFTVNVTLPSYTPSVTPVVVTATNTTSGVTLSPASVTINANYAFNLAQTLGGTYVTSDPTNSSKNVTTATNFANGSAINVEAGTSVFANVYGVNGAGNVNFGGDNLSITSSNSSVVNVVAPASGSSAVANAANVTSSVYGVKLLAGLAGSAVITVKDTSDYNSPSISFTVNVGGTGQLGSVAVSGLTANQNVVSGQSYPISVALADAGGNAYYIPATNATGDTIVLSDTSGVGGNFRNSSGASIPSVSIAPGTGSQTIYWVAPATKGNVTINASVTVNGVTYSSVPVTVTVQ